MLRQHRVNGAPVVICRRGAVRHRQPHLQCGRLWPVCQRGGQHRRGVHPGHRQAAHQGGLGVLKSKHANHSLYLEIWLHRRRLPPGQRQAAEKGGRLYHPVLSFTLAPVIRVVVDPIAHVQLMSTLGPCKLPIKPCGRNVAMVWNAIGLPTAGAAASQVVSFTVPFSAFP
jgi:hypothetical protein